MKQQPNAAKAEHNVITFRAIKSDADNIATLQRRFGLKRSAAIRLALRMAAGANDTPQRAA